MSAQIATVMSWGWRHQTIARPVDFDERFEVIDVYTPPPLEQ